VTVESNLYEAALKKYALLLTNAAKRTLGTRTIGKNKTYGKASGGLQRSLTYQIDGKNVIFGSQKFPLVGAFIFWGVNGTEKRRGSPFSYGSKQPPSGKNSDIRKWMRSKPVRLRDENGSFVKQTEARLSSAAYLIARSIKKKGIAGLKYWEKAYEATFPKAEKELGEAFANDLFSHFAVKAGNIKLTKKL
tara:strand:- start:4529 stop:5101 length:573 start_codon:yes stop_codon:yes gene_type:complete